MTVGLALHTALPTTAIVDGLIPLGIACTGHLQEPGTALVAHLLSMELCFVPLTTT